MPLSLRLLLYAWMAAPLLVVSVTRVRWRAFARVAIVPAQAIVLFGLFEVGYAVENQFPLLTILTWVLAVTCFLEIGHLLVYREAMTISAYSEILAATPSEWRAYLSAQRPAHILGAAGASLACLAAWVLLRAHPSDHTLAWPGGVCAAALIGATAIRGREYIFYPVRPVSLALRAALGFSRLGRRVEARRSLPSALRKRGALHPKKVVVVIGESVRRSSLSLYGYERPTTPRLEARSAELVVFEDAISPANSTRGSLAYALTDRTFRGGPGTGTSVLHYLADAGYRTHWISNQDRVGLFDHEVSDIAADAECSVFRRSTGPDAVLLPHLTRALAEDGPSAIFLHMIGSHFPYEGRVEPGFRYYGSRARLQSEARSRGAIVGHYDDTIRYLDYFLDAVIEACRACRCSTVLAFFSDHGEALFDDGRSQLHGNPQPLRKEYEVPYFYWVGPGYHRGATDNPLLQLGPRVPGFCHLENFFDDLAIVLGLDLANGTSRESNFQPRPSHGSDRRQIVSRDRIVDFVALAET